MIIKCTEKQRKFLLKTRCPEDILEIDESAECKNRECVDCYRDHNIKFEIEGEKDMNKEILRLLKNLKPMIEAEVLDEEFEAFAENENIKTISDLNDTIEDELSYWAEDGQNE